MRIIRGKYGRRRFDVPRNITARPTTDFARENIFNVIENLRSPEGCSVADIFAGTGAVSFEFLSRGASEVVAVETAATQANFIRDVARKLGDDNLRVVRGDAFRFIAGASRAFDFVFADPPYNHPRFAEIPSLVLESALLGPGSIFILEHSGSHSFASLPHFYEHRSYGSVNFSIFRIPEAAGDSQQSDIPQSHGSED